MIDHVFTEVLRIIHDNLGHTVAWAVAGNANLRLQGMVIEPRDVDIVIRRGDLETVRELFYCYSPSPVLKLETLSGTPAWEARATINGVGIQFFGGDEMDIYVSRLLAGDHRDNAGGC